MRLHLLLSACLLGVTLTAGARGDAPFIPEVPAQPVQKGKLPAKLPQCGLPPAKLRDNLCTLTYRISTTSPEAQAHFDQGLGYYYSYVWTEAVRSFETASYYDPDCAIIHWELSRALEKWGRTQPANAAVQKADALKASASWNEQQLILARMQERGLAPNVGDAEAREKAAIQTIDNLLAVHDDDEEGWYYRAHLAGGQGFGGVVGAVPFYKALLKVNPLHPGANHELVHYYENARRPALGMPYADNYIKSSPGIPHAFHMQAHLATRLGRWDKSTERSLHAIELHQKYFQEMSITPREDQQYGHHLEIATVSLTHDGRFAEAKAMKELTQKAGQQLNNPWFRLHLAERDWDAALKEAAVLGKRDKLTASYLKALVYLAQARPEQAAPEVEVLRQAYQNNKNDKRLELRLWETQGLLLCQTGGGESGVPLLEKAVQKTKDDYSHHAWGNGAYYMETWGIGALQANKLEAAEEAFLEALAHDSGSVRAALGMQVICERQKRTQEAARYEQLAKKFWSKANPKDLEAELKALRGNEAVQSSSR